MWGIDQPIENLKRYTFWYTLQDVYNNGLYNDAQYSDKILLDIVSFERRFIY